MTPRGDIRVLIDGFLQADKFLAGLPQWVEDPGESCCRWSRPIEVHGEQPGLNFVVKSYPREKPPQFRILLMAQKCVWRLDVTNDERLNPLSAPFNPGIPITGPHYHCWADNRVFATVNSLPSKLKNARILKESFRSFDSAFRWFCGETNIVVVTSEIPSLPRAGTFI